MNASQCATNVWVMVFGHFRKRDPLPRSIHLETRAINTYYTFAMLPRSSNSFGVCKSRFFSCLWDKKNQKPMVHTVNGRANAMKTQKSFPTFIVEVDALK